MTLGKKTYEFIDIENNNHVLECAQNLDCTIDELLYCVSKVGKSLKSIELYLEMNRDIIEIYIQNARKV